MAYLEKLPSGKYRYQVTMTINGQRKRKSFTGKTKKEALFKMTDWLKNNPTITDEKCNLAMAIESYIESRKNILSPSTITGYRKIQRIYVKDKPIGKIEIERLRNEDLQIFVNELAKNHTPKYVKNVYSFIHSAVKSVNPYATYVITLPKSEPLERDIPDDEEVKHLIELADDELKIAIMLAAFGTMRRGEICSATYEDIEGNTLHVHTDIVKDENGKWVIKNMPKTASSDRYIPLPDFLIALIGEGTGPIIKSKPNTISNRFRRLRKEVGLNCRFHDLRHYAASIMHSIGIPDQYIMERGGWSSDSVLKSVYRNVLKDKNNEFSKKTNEYFEKNFISES